MRIHERVDVVVIGGGHAGAEAANAAARMGVSVLLVTANLETIGQMSCNPAIGGVAKGTVVREVDALGGVMGRAADRSTIQFRMLNRSKGPAVWSPRAQCDRGLYRRAVRELLERQPGLRTVQGMVRRLLLDGDRVTGVETTDGRRFAARAVVVTAGTFLRGRIHLGTDHRTEAGRAGDAPAIDLAEQLEAMGLRVDRFKTGTPPRIDGRSVDYSVLERQDGDAEGYRFSQYETCERPAARPCWITSAGPAVRDVISRNLHQSALYGGEIAGRGPRYCPSIEDKIVKFPDAESHQVFLEPEGLDTSELYVNGLSTSLPVDVQQAFLEAIPGLATVRMTRPGYAIEYDYYPPDQLTPWLEVKAVEDLFFAGQINGTTGYEEAAGQGVLAGVNAAQRARERDPFTMRRDEGYIGVLVDDLVTRGVDEPYRLFTSRAEYRLLLRQDNALRRLGPRAAALGLLTEVERDALLAREGAEDELMDLARSRTVRPGECIDYLDAIGEPQISEPQKVAALVRRPGVRLEALLDLVDPGTEVEPEVMLSAEIELKYEGYLRRERDSVERLAGMAEFALPEDLPYHELFSLSTEARHKLAAVQPSSLAQAGRVPGVSPSDLQNLVGEVLRRRQPAA